MEHNLGLHLRPRCRVSCRFRASKRNAMGFSEGHQRRRASATRGDGTHKVSLDQVIATHGARPVQICPPSIKRPPRAGLAVKRAGVLEPTRARPDALGDRVPGPRLDEGRCRFERGRRPAVRQGLVRALGEADAAHSDDRGSQGPGSRGRVETWRAGAKRLKEGRPLRPPVCAPAAESQSLAASTSLLGGDLRPSSGQRLQQLCDYRATEEI